MLSIFYALILCFCLSGLSALLGEEHPGLRWGMGLIAAIVLISEGSYAAIFPAGEGPLTLNSVAALVYYMLAAGMGGKLWDRLR